MAQRSGLNDLQTAVLAWVGDGCPDGVFDSTAHRVTAAALRRRGLILTDGRGALNGDQLEVTLYQPFDLTEVG